MDLFKIFRSGNHPCRQRRGNYDTMRATSVPTVSSSPFARLRNAAGKKANDPSDDDRSGADDDDSTEGDDEDQEDDGTAKRPRKKKAKRRAKKKADDDSDQNDEEEPQARAIRQRERARVATILELRCSRTVAGDGAPPGAANTDAAPCSRENARSRGARSTGACTRRQRFAARSHGWRAIARCRRQCSGGSAAGQRQGDRQFHHRSRQKTPR